jgi:hypothetical protein
VSHAVVLAHVLPVGSQVAGDCCWQLVAPGSHVAQAASAAAQTCPLVLQSVVDCQDAAPDVMPHVWTVLPLHRASPTVQTGFTSVTMSRYAGS